MDSMKMQAQQLLAELPETISRHDALDCLVSNLGIEDAEAEQILKDLSWEAEEDDNV